MNFKNARSKNALSTDYPIDPQAFERFFDLALDLLCIAGIDGRFIRLNSQWAEVLGYSLEELEGQEFIRFVHPDDVQPTLEALAELGAHREVLNFTNRYRCKDGTYRWIEWRSYPFGEHIYAAARDITRRVGVEEELRVSVEHQQLTSAVAQTFASGGDFDEQLDRCLSLAGTQVGASRAYVFIDSEDGSVTSNTHEWCAPGIPPQIDSLQQVPYGVIPSWRPLLVSEGRISRDDISTLPADIREALEPQGIAAITVEPLQMNGALCGFVGFDECTGQRAWTDAERRLLSTVAGIISSAFERHLGQSRLKLNEEKLRRILEGTNAGTWEWNIQTGETVFNERWAAIAGYSLGELQPVSIDTWYSLTHPDDLRRSQRLIERHLAGETDNYDCEVRMLHKDGRWIWVRDRGKLTDRDAQGKPLRMFGTYMDITDRREALTRLEQNKRLLDLFFRQSLDGFFFMMLDEPVEWNDSVDKEAVLDYVFTHQRITRVNQAMLDQYRATEGDFVGLTPTDFFAHDREQGRRLWRTFFDQGHLHIDTEERRFDGEEIIIEGDYICMYDDDGRLTGNFGVQRDVTHARNAQAALEESEKRFRELSIRDGLTGVFNRRYLIDRLAQELSKAARNGGRIAVAILDIDHFKGINDVQGHLAGDFVLQEFARTLGDALRQYDVLGRYGGEEFLVIFDAMDRRTAGQRLETLLGRVAATPYRYEDTEISVSFSGGVTDTDEFAGAAPTPEGLLSRADDRLYQAKAGGRRQVRWETAESGAPPDPCELSEFEL